MTVLENIESLKKSLDLDMLEDALDITIVKSYGQEDICHCPLPSHNGYDANPSFSINRQKLVYNCFACGIGGNIIDLVARVLNLDYDDAFKFCKTYGVDESAELSFEDRLKNIFVNPMSYSPPPTLPRYSRSVLTEWVQQYSDYYEERGISAEFQDKFLLGFDANHKRGDYVGPAAIIPHFFEGDLVGYQERWIDNARPKHIPKYTNSSNFPKAETLFAYDYAIEDNSSPVIVVESALTSVYLHQMGYNSVSTFGASVSDAQIKLLQSFSWGVILSFDNDVAGQKACDHVGERLKKTVPVHVVDIDGEEKQDLNDLPPEKVATLIGSAKPWFMKGL